MNTPAEIAVIHAILDWASKIFWTVGAPVLVVLLTKKSTWKRLRWRRTPKDSQEQIPYAQATRRKGLRITSGILILILWEIFQIHCWGNARPLSTDDFATGLTLAVMFLTWLLWD